MKDLRMNRIFAKDGNTLIVAMDHAATMGVLPGLQNPGYVIEKITLGGADAIMTSYGVISRFGHMIRGLGVILRVDGGTSALGDKATGFMQEIYTVEDALRLGADAVVCMGFPGSKNEHLTLNYLSRVVAEAEKWGVPVLAEMLPRGFESREDSRTVENIKTAVRIGAELGVDFIKTQYTGTVDSFREIVESVYVPVVVLGGSKMETDIDVLQTVHSAMEAGARGVAIGRNIWQHPAPEKMTRALHAIIHEGVSVSQASKYLC
ncbi:MAG: fructose-bisphosphate aldolase [Candidatus Fermentithermobacillus carboniphilus]|uniref:Fructose-bisphosphate aldolase n=1 Tax=Candidatus Fermentithermobacillus carboniphilus TaxID=3085328 RepID=A0AAT9LGS3_9FIRM|nr:MAG: fructose-bisphosphate aldolase [Candidatus Fermentithermobacillus carboniphilus]